MFLVIEKILFIGGILLTLVFMRKVAGSHLAAQVNNDFLTSYEKIYVWILSLASPILAGIILYYGWRKILPRKASSANIISIMAFFIIVLARIIYSVFLRRL